MLKIRYFTAAAAVALCGALIAPVGCKKSEEAKPAAGAPVKKDDPVAVGEKPAVAAPVVAANPVVPDVDLAAGDGIAGWVSLKSLTGTFNAIEAIGGKLGLVPPGGQMRQQGIAQATASLAQAGIKDIDWLDQNRAIHLVYHDQVVAGAVPGAKPNPKEIAGGVFFVLPITSKEAALAAMTTALKDAAAEGHAASIATPTGDKAYVDFLEKHAVITMVDKDRFAKIKGFAERIAKVDPPSAIYFGLSVEDLSKTRKAEIDQMMAMVEGMGAAAAGKESDPTKANINKQVMGMYTKMLKTYLTDLTRVEILVHADVNDAKLEVRVQAKDGSKLGKQLAAGKGRSSTGIANLLPSNSYFAVAASSDPAASAEQADDALVMMKEMFKMDQVAFDAMAKDMKDIAKLMDGNSAFGVYPDGPAAVGFVLISGATDGEAALRVGKRLVGALVSHVLKIAQEEQKAKGKTMDPAEAEMLALVEQSMKDGKLEPILAKFGPLAAAKGITLTLATNKDGDVACDVLDIAVDFAKMPPGRDTDQVKAIIGEKTAFALCSSKGKITLAAGPGALEKGKAAASGKVGGLAEAPAYKSATADRDSNVVVYINPGAGLAAFKAIAPPNMTLSGDKAITFTCANLSRSCSCSFGVPVDLAAAAKALAGGMGGGGMAPPPGPGPVGGDMKAPELPPPPEAVKPVK